MKLIYIANIRLPSEKAETLQVMKMCSALAAQPGLTVSLVVPRRLTPFKKNFDVFKYYKVLKNFHIIKIPTIDLMPWQNIFGHLAFKLNAWLFARLAAVYTRRHQPDLVYSRDWRILERLQNHSFLLAFELHDYRPPMAAAYKLMAKICRKMMVISQGLKDKLLADGIPDDKIVIARDAVDPAEFNLTLSQAEVRKKLNLPTNKNLIIYTGGLYAWKGIETLLAGFDKLQKNLAGARLILIGGTTADVNSVKARLKLNKINNILILGYQPYRLMPYFLSAADVLVLADSAKFAIARDYTSPLKLFQYMAARKPVVASATPALKEILNHTNAWLFQPDNPTSLSTALKQALTNTKTSQEKASAAWRTAQQHTWTIRAKSILSSVKTS